MKLRIAAICILILGLVCIVAGLYAAGAGVLVIGTIALVRSLRPGGYWRKADAEAAAKDGDTPTT
jgi:hypothetical protein